MGFVWIDIIKESSKFLIQYRNLPSSNMYTISDLLKECYHWLWVDIVEKNH